MIKTTQNIRSQIDWAVCDKFHSACLRSGLSAVSSGSIDYGRKAQAECNVCGRLVLFRSLELGIWILFVICDLVLEILIPLASTISK